MEIDFIINNIYPLPESSINSFKEAISLVTFPKGHILMHENKIENHIYIIKKGIVRAYTNFDGKEVTFWFGKEGDTVLSLKNYVLNQKSYENIELLEESSFYKINQSILNQLLTSDIHIANWARKMAELELIKTEKRLIDIQFKKASDRYEDLINHRPDLFQRVPLGIIASYLGISQVSLSRIRATQNIKSI
jgi:CRP-like cAMP-binding protein